MKAVSLFVFFFASAIKIASSGLHLGPGPVTCYFNVVPEYTVVETRREWFSALLDCRARGLELAAILSKEQESAVEAIVHKYNNTVPIGPPIRICPFNVEPDYTVVETPREWFPALLDCRARGLELAAILSKEQESAVEAIVHKYNNTGFRQDGFWIGASNRGLKTIGFQATFIKIFRR